MTRPREFEDDDPITLETASKVVLRGAVTVSTLRAEIKRGNLGALRIGKNLFTTPADITAYMGAAAVLHGEYWLGNRPGQKQKQAADAVTRRRA